jgi:hypothetical protein
VTTRSVILSRAFGRIGITDYAYGVTADEQADARTSLNAMMAEWFGSGVDLAYTPSADADNDAVAMTTPEWADAAIWNNLALRLAPDYGKEPSRDLRRDAKRGYDLCVAKTLVMPVDRRAPLRVYGGGDWRGR